MSWKAAVSIPLLAGQPRSASALLLLSLSLMLSLLPLLIISACCFACGTVATEPRLQSQLCKPTKSEMANTIF